MLEIQKSCSFPRKDSKGTKIATDVKRLMDSQAIQAENYDIFR